MGVLSCGNSKIEGFEGVFSCGQLLESDVV